jgi:hypothetical protein
MLNLLEAPPPILPDAVFSINLLDAFMVYVTLAFVASLVLRMRLYLSIYRIATFVAASCPNVFKLVHQHIFVLVQNGIVGLGAAYGGVLGVYFLVTKVLFPESSLSVNDLSGHPLALLCMLVLCGLMVAVDTVLIVQVGTVDPKYVEEQLRFAEGWLGGRINRALDILGSWNPIRRIADWQTHVALREFNHLFRYNLALMLYQTAIRAILVLFLFGLRIKLYFGM